MLLKDKKALIFGVANNRSIAYGISKAFKDNGAKLAFNYMGDAIKKRVEPISEELGGDFIFPCDVTSDPQIEESVAIVKEKWGKVDTIVHSVAYADKEDLQGRFLDTSRDGFLLAMNVSSYSLVALCKAYEPILNPGASIMCLTYYGAEKAVPRYNVMGVAKAALECSVKYLARDFGKNNIRINAISAGPIKTLSASGISDFRLILNHIEENAPLGRNVTIEDVGNTALYFASDLSSAVTGEIHHVDCGFQSIAF